MLSPNVRRTLFQDDGEYVAVDLGLYQQRARKIGVDGQAEQAVLILPERFSQELPPQRAGLTPPFEFDDLPSQRISADGLQPLLCSDTCDFSG